MEFFDLIILIYCIGAVIGLIHEITKDNESIADEIHDAEKLAAIGRLVEVMTKFNNDCESRKRKYEIY